jgi:hypothetical protein
MIGQAPGVADAELAADPRRSSRRVLYPLSGNAPADLAIRLLTELPADAWSLESIPSPTGYPWLGEADLSYHAEQFGRTGFTGALNRYRNVDRDWHERPELGVTTVAQPVLFVTGALDTATRLGSLDAMRARAQPLGAGGAALQGAYSPWLPRTLTFAVTRLLMPRPGGRR